MAVHYFAQPIWFDNAEGFPCMTKPICGQATRQIGVGEVTRERANVTCKKCLASLNRKPKAKPVSAKPKRVHLWFTERPDGNTCVSATQGDTELFWAVLNPADAKAAWERLRAQYPDAKVSI